MPRESPIETAMKEQLHALFGTAVCAPHKTIDAVSIGAAQRMAKFCWAQEVMVDRYRLDFLIVGFGDFGSACLLAVECDGHEFHGGNRDGARRDRVRDRTLAGRGITTIRFAGSEIFADAKSCAAEAASLAAAFLRGQESNITSVVMGGYADDIIAAESREGYP